MNQLIIKLITILIFVFSHKYYVSSTLIDYSEKSGTYQISLKIFHDDLEKDLGFEMNELDYDDYKQTNSIIKESGYIYFWKMIDYSEPIVESSNYYSVKVYIKGDCKIKRIKTLSYVFSTGRKGMGQSDQQESVNKNWKYPTPESIDYSLLKKLC